MTAMLSPSGGRTPSGGPARLDVLRAPALTDAELVSWVISGRDGAAARLYDRCAPVINRVTLRVLGGDTEHDDIVQETFLKVWKLIEAGKLQKPESLTSWVAAVTTNTVYKELRKRYVRRKFFGREEPPPEALSTLPDMESREGLRIVYAILAELPPDERLAFSLRYLGEHGLSDVAAMSDCSLATVKRRIARAQKKFVEKARAYPEFPRLVGLLGEEGSP